MIRIRPPHLNLLESVLAMLLLAFSLQLANAYAWSLAGHLALSWTGSVAIGGLAVAGIITRWRAAPPDQRQPLLAAWSWPAPWLLLAIMVWQIASYPPAMHDALSYRLPRIFLWLQHGALYLPETPDSRMIAMPWGWELLALPWVALNAVRFTALLNLLAWCLCMTLIYHWATEAGADQRRARWLALALATAPFCLLQATSQANDLFAAVLLLVAIFFMWRFASEPNNHRLQLSLVAWMMACGVKPHFLVLGLGWGVWWLCDPTQPWRHTKLPALLRMVPWLLIVSPLPILISNFLHAGSLMGASSADDVVGASPWKNTIAATLQFLSAQLQLPVMPGADRLSALLQALPPVAALKQATPQLQPAVGLLPIIDQASLGLIHTGLLAAGIITGWKSASRRDHGLIGIALLGFLIAAAMVVPMTIGRSFFGFAALCIAPATAGLAMARGRWVMPLCVLAVSGGLLALVLNPSCPAWPSRTVAGLARTSGHPQVADTLARYHAYQERATTGRGILDPVPAGTPVAVLARGITPLANLWAPDWHNHPIEFVHQLPAQRFQTGRHRWLLIAENARESYPQQVADYQSLRGWQVVRQASYRHLLSSNAEQWSLYQKP